MNQTFADGLEKSLHEMLPLVKALEIRVEEARPGHIKVSMSQSPIVVNHFGAFHAGALYTFAETVGGAVVKASFDWEDTTLINKRGVISYRKMVMRKVMSEASFSAEDVARIKAEVEEKGRTEFPYTVIVRNEDDEVACEATFDFYARKNRG